MRGVGGTTYRVEGRAGSKEPPRRPTSPFPSESGATLQQLRRASVAKGPHSLIESAKLAGVEPRVYLREATLRAVRNPGTVTLVRDLKSSES